MKRIYRLVVMLVLFVPLISCSDKCLIEPTAVEEELNVRYYIKYEVFSENGLNEVTIRNNGGDKSYQDIKAGDWSIIVGPVKGRFQAGIRAFGGDARISVCREDEPFVLVAEEKGMIPYGGLYHIIEPF